MGDNMKEFSLEEYLKNPNREVVTRDGRKVRIICTDFDNPDYPVVGEIKGHKWPLSFATNGEAIKGRQLACDLFFAPEKHEGWIIINMWPDGERDTNGIIYHNKLDIPDMPPVGGKRVATIKIEWEE